MYCSICGNDVDPIEEPKNPAGDLLYYCPECLEVLDEEEAEEPESD